jgi:lipopolysaccharide/colanic/teichoic acid biosynthesis glycosyltransferase
MSFVGPRPLPVKEARNLPAVWREWRKKVKPGVFSRWALSPEKHSTLDKWEQLEKMTVQSGSVRDDLQLLLTTVFALLFK